MHLILKCVIAYENFYVNNIQYLACSLEDAVICDSQITIEGINIGFGVNCRTGQFGLFPIKNFIVFDSTNTVNKGLSKIVRKHQANIDLKSKTIIPGIFHRTSKKSIGFATMCAVCGEYIIGMRLDFIHCILCNQIFHTLCLKNHTALKKCHRFLKITNHNIVSSFKSIETDLRDWSKEQILQWLCSANLLSLLNLFDVQNIDGAVLLNLIPENGDAVVMEKCTLPFWSLISDKFYRESLYLAILDLIGRCEDASKNIRTRSKLKSDLVYDGTLSSSTKSYIIENGNHHLREVTYVSKTYCEYCSNILLGINRQGLHCVKCRLDFHKTCAAQIDILNCPGTIIDEALDYLDSSVFGVPLRHQARDKSSVPKFLKCCIRHLESRQGVTSAGRKLLDLYGERASTDDVIILRTMFSHPSYDENGDLVGLSRLSSSQVALLVRLFLKELPEPLFTYALYHSFVEAFQVDQDDYTNCFRLHSLLSYLPPANRSTLLVLVNHFEYICQRPICEQTKVAQTAEKWSNIFSKLLIWPPHIILTEIINYRRKQKKVIQLLFEYKLFAFERFIWPIFTQSEYMDCADNVMNLSQSMSPNQLENLQYEVTDFNEDIHSQDWYWSDTTKEEVNDLMVGLQDGSFLVRDSSNKIPGEYTLTVRKDGENKLIRIMSNGAFFGFKEPYEFRSVVELINYHRAVKLSSYNEQLNMILRFPVSKSKSDIYGYSNDSHELDDNALIDLFYNTMKEYMELNTQVDKNTAEKENLQKELDELTKTIKGFNVVDAWCRTHIEHIMNQMFTNPKLKDHNQKSLSILNTKLNNCAESIKLSSQLRENLTARNTALINSLATDRPYLKKLNRRQQQCISLLKERGVPAGMFDSDNVLLEALCEQIRDNLNSSNPINDQSTWFIEVLNRSEATAMLTGKRHGTFLVRKSSEANSYALDIVVGNTVQHCLIFCRDGMYGFVKNECLYASLCNLVKTFHLRSLDQYNPELKTKLSYPVKCA